jgi:hypothetical protein
MLRDTGKDFPFYLAPGIRDQATSSIGTGRKLLKSTDGEMRILIPFHHSGCPDPA